MRSYIQILSIASLIYAGCSSQEFAGEVGVRRSLESNKKNPPPPTTPPEVPPVTVPDDNDLLTDDGGTLKLAPRACDAASLVAVNNGRCPESYAVFGIDDPMSSQRRGTLACCPLPAGDILVGELIPRVSECAVDEVIVGHAGNSQLFCRAINKEKYKLINAQATCYAGKGHAGKGNAPKCVNTPEALKDIVGAKGKFGSDGCLNVPYGSLSVKQRGRNCDGQKAMQLMFKESGLPVKMFK